MTPIRILVGLLASAFSSLGFALFFRVRRRHLLATAIGGLLGYAVYLLVGEYVGGEFFSNFTAAFLTAFYCEACAKFLRAPVQIYLIPVLIPLFPGGSLYYSMYYLLAKDYAVFSEYIVMTLEAALGIAGGMVVGIAVAVFCFSRFRKNAAGKREKSIKPTETNENR